MIGQFKYWFRNRASGHKRMESQYNISSLVMVAISSLMVIFAATKPNVIKYNIGFFKYKSSGLRPAIRTNGTTKRSSGTPGDKALFPSSDQTPDPNMAETRWIAIRPNCVSVTSMSPILYIQRIITPGCSEVLQNNDGEIFPGKK